VSEARLEQLPDGSARIHFAAPILHHTEPKGFCTLRPPTSDEYLTHRDPSNWLTSGDAVTPFVDGEIIRAYAKILMVDHDVDMVLRHAPLEVGLLIEEAILGFFRNARKRSKPASAPSSAPA
jgi:hypothetical protein